MGKIAMEDRVWYHIYPFGFCGALADNDFACPPGPGLREIAGHVERLAGLGIGGLYIGPLFESETHGYDTVDYFWVDRRLGCNGDLKALVQRCHERGIAVILDGVFNHSGRHFFAFKDIQRRGPASAYRDWYAGLDFSRRSPLGDSFNYQTWAGHYGLPKFNGASPGLRSHLLDAVEFWIREFDIDGLRLDAACDLLPEFMDALAARCRSLKPDFWLMGEVVAGDYRNWAREGRLDSVTNYELYKGLWSSFNDHNFYELAWTLNRQFGAEGMYRGLGLYNFADNHDVNRIASTLKNRAHLPLLYGLLFTLPGVPSIYYGSEYGVEGARTEWSDRELRPRWDPGWEKRGNAQGGPGLCALIAALIKTREAYPALRRGGFRQLYLSHGQYAFLREGDSRPLMTLVNASDGERLITVPPGLPGGTWRDLGSGEELRASPQGLPVRMAPFSLRILCGS